MCATCEEIHKQEQAALNIGFKSNGMWITTDGREHYSRRLAIAEQILIDEDEKVNDE